MQRHLQNEGVLAFSLLWQSLGQGRADSRSSARDVLFLTSRDFSSSRVLELDGSSKVLPCSEPACVVQDRGASDAWQAR